MLAKERGWRIENIKELAKISNRLINREVVKVATYETIFNSIENRENLKLIDFKDIDRDSVVISPTIRSNRLNSHPKGIYWNWVPIGGTSRDVNREIHFGAIYSDIQHKTRWILETGAGFILDGQKGGWKRGLSGKFGPKGV